MNDELKEKIAEIIHPCYEPECDIGNSCPKCRQAGSEADQIINLLASEGYGKMVERGELKETLSFDARGLPVKFWSKEKVFQPIVEVKP